VFGCSDGSDGSGVRGWMVDHCRCSDGSWMDG